MAVFKRHSDQGRIQDPGFGEKVGGRTKRIINKDGSFNTHREGVNNGLRNIYQRLLSIRNVNFFLLSLGTYVLCSLVFAGVFFMIGTEHLIGVRGETAMTSFMDCFYFSTQTFTTVGYGSIAPKGVLASTVASFEAFCGLLFFAVATGLMYARFSKPKAMLLYSDNALIAPYQEGKALMFRLANQRTNVLMELQARVILMMRSDKDDNTSRKYFELPLEIGKVIFLPLSWTLVHKIDDKSPLADYNEQDLIDLDAEVMILISGFDDTFNQTVHSRYSYVASEFVWNARFKKAFKIDQNGDAILDLPAIHDYEIVGTTNS